MRMVWKVEERGARGRRTTTRRPLEMESLEDRKLLSTGSSDYLLSGSSWPNPGHITYSIAPDGVAWDAGTNNLSATFNALFGNGTWQREIARALATWEDYANINIAPVGETGMNPIDTFGAAQGDPRFGDIRFGGANFNDNSTLAMSFSPPASNGSYTNTIYGNVEINTAMPWHIGSDFDLYSVMLHETGLTLGLNEPPPGGDVVMNTVYGGVRSGLMPGDIAGIQAIYGARTADVYQSQGQGTGLSSAVDVTSAVGGSLHATLNNVSLWTVGDAEYFSVVVPSNGGGTLSVTASAAGISMLSPAVTVYNASGQAVASQSNPSAWSDAVTAQVGGLVPGQRYFIKVSGATNDAFAAGAYQLQVSFPNGTPVSSPPTSTPHPTPTPVTPVVPSHPVTSHPTKTKHAHVPVRPVRHPHSHPRRVPTIHKSLHP
ncbi:MAG: matrixin family metalloprotease [Isosphaeraceae bacterium]|nr:matrixin family metalloprotease [Isosphaeraceae bacterium]